MKKILFLLIIFGLFAFSLTAKADSLLEKWARSIDDTSRCYKTDTKCLETFKKTGCRGGISNDSLQRQYECAQLFYQEQQNKLIMSQQASQTTLKEKEQTTKELELNNQKLQELFKEQGQRIDSLTASLKNAKLLNIGLLGILGIFFIYFIYITFRKKEEKTKCSQCKYLKKGEGIESFISPQGVPTTVHRGRFYCEADTSKRFTDKEISIPRECQNYRPSTLSLYQEVGKDIKSKLGNIIDKIIKKFKK
ncbi:hypothetical protein GW950_01940 [Candidatus Wolfebacteria bacterium]|nr:hypothetical protein [Candidatus Wolfebacteria bacterium]